MSGNSMELIQNLPEFVLGHFKLLLAARVSDLWNKILFQHDGWVVDALPVKFEGGNDVLSRAFIRERRPFSGGVVAVVGVFVMMVIELLRVERALLAHH